MTSAQLPDHHGTNLKDKTADALLRIEIISEYQQFMAMKLVWNTLLAESHYDHAYFTHEWFDCWWQAFGAGKRLFIMAVWEGMQLRAIAPLMICKSSRWLMPVQMIKFISNDYSPRCDLIISDNLKDTTKLIAIIFAAIASPERQGDLLLLENIQSDSEHLASFKKMSETANASYVSDLKLCTPWIDTTRDWETFYASLPRRIKMTFNNIRNRLHRLGDVQICKFKTLASLEDMAAVSRKSWKFREGKSFVSTPARKKFFELLSRAAGEKGWLRCWILMVDDQPIAFEYHLRYKSKEIALLADFNQDFAAYSPGAYLDHCITKEIFDDEISEYDLGGSFDQYKKKWQPKLRHSEDCYFYGSAPLARLLNALDARLVPPLRGLKKQLNALVAQGKIAIFSQPPKGK